MAPEELGRQYLYRVELESRGEEAVLRLALRLWRADRFELRATDAFGRAAWRLEVAGDEGVWSGARGGGRCRVGAGSLTVVAALRWPLAPAALPPLLLGHLPVAPSPAAALSASGESRFRDAQGRAWRVRLVAGRPDSWSVELDPATQLEWRRDGARARLASPAEELVLQWRETRREPLRGAEPAWIPEPDLPLCSDADLS